MAWINIASTKYKIRQNLIKSLEGWESGIDLIGDHRFGLSALMYGDIKLYEQTKKFTASWLAYYLKKDNDVLAQPNVFPSFVGLSILSGLDESDQGVLARVMEIALPQAHPYRSLQTLVKKYLEGDTLQNGKSREGHVDTEKEWEKAVTKHNASNLFDLAICPDHPLWTMTLSNYCLPLALLLHKAERAKKDCPAITEYFRLGATPHRHTQVLFERPTNKPLLEANVSKESSTWPGFDAIEIQEDELVIYYWLGFSWKASLKFDSKEPLNAFRSFLYMDYNWEIVKKNVDVATWSTIQSYRESGKATYVLVSNKSWSKEKVDQTQAAATFLKEKIRVADFLAV